MGCGGSRGWGAVTVDIDRWMATGGVAEARGPTGFVGPSDDVVWTVSGAGLPVALVGIGRTTGLGRTARRSGDGVNGKVGAVSGSTGGANEAGNLWTVVGSPGPDCTDGTDCVDFGDRRAWPVGSAGVNCTEGAGGTDGVDCGCTTVVGSKFASGPATGEAS